MKKSTKNLLMWGGLIAAGIYVITKKDTVVVVKEPGGIVPGTPVNPGDLPFPDSSGGTQLTGDDNLSI